MAGRAGARRGVPAGDEARRRGVLRAPRRGAGGSGLRGGRARPGPVERGGDPVAGGPRRRRHRHRGRAGLGGAGGAGRRRDVRRGARPLAVRPERAAARFRPLPLQARVARGAAGRRRRRAGRRDRAGRHEHRPRRRRRVRPRGLRRPDPRHAAGAGGARGAPGPGAPRRRPGAVAVGADLHLLGLPCRDVPQGPRDADRPGPGVRARRGAGRGGVGGPPGPEGQRPERPRPGDRRPRRGPRRRHRPGGAPAVGEARQARIGEAPRRDNPAARLDVTTARSDTSEEGVPWAA